MSDFYWKKSVLDRLDALLTKADNILAAIDVLATQEVKMSQELDDLGVAVTNVQGAADSAIALVTGLADYIRAHADDPAALRAYADSLNAKASEIGTAVAANPVPTP